MAIANAAQRAAFTANFDALPIDARTSIIASLNWLLAFERNYQNEGSPVEPAARTVVPVDVARDKDSAKYRAEIVAKIWEPDLRSELVDRIVAAIAAGWTDKKSAKAAIKKAVDARNEYDRSGGTRGKDSVWKPLATWLKGVFESNGVEWTPTASAIEPRPELEKTPPRKVRLPGGEVAFENEI